MALSASLTFYDAPGSGTTPGATFGGGECCFAAAGTFAGATLALELLAPDGATWLAVPGAALTAPGLAIVKLPPGAVRVAVSGGPPSGLRASLSRVIA